MEAIATTDPFTDTPQRLTVVIEVVADPSEARDGMPATPYLSRAVLFRFVRSSDQVRIRCELRYHVQGVVEAQFWTNGQLLVGRRFDTRPQAVLWARVQRRVIKKGSVR